MITTGVQEIGSTKVNWPLVYGIFYCIWLAPRWQGLIPIQGLGQKNGPTSACMCASICSQTHMCAYMFSKNSFDCLYVLQNSYVHLYVRTYKSTYERTYEHTYEIWSKWERTYDIWSTYKRTYRGTYERSYERFLAPSP